ncbi:MAG: two-component system sensor histidine kinase NtrB [Thermodesulfovibrionales bacterium]
MSRSDSREDPAAGIKKSQHQWQTTLDAITDYIFVIDRNREIKRANLSFSRRFNKHPKDVVGMKVDQLFQFYVPHTNCLVDRAFATNQEVVDEMTIDGSTYMTSIFPVGLDEDQTFVCVMKDITEMKGLQDRIYHSYKLASIGQLVSGVAHEINNPLTGILGYAELLMMKVKDDSIKNDLQKIYAAADRCRIIVEGLLCFSRQQKAHKNLAGINDVIDQTLELRTYWLKSGDLDIVRDFHELPRTLIDVQQMQHALLNIIMNAEQAVRNTGRRGRIVISTQYDNSTKKITITVADNGTGIPEDLLGKIFDPFFTSKPVGEGSGLGLSMSYGIIAEHGGSIAAESRPGEGATFTIVLPVKKSETAEADQPQ